MTKYYTLAIRENNQWVIEFGDYDKEVVKQEQDDFCEHRYKRKDTKIVTHASDLHADIIKDYEKLNASEGSE